MKSFKVAVVGIVTTLTLVNPGLILAQTAAVQPLPVASSTSTLSPAAKFPVLKSRAVKEINRRIGTLNALSTRLSTIAPPRLSADNKKILQDLVSADNTAMQALLVKVNADTTLDTLRVDVASITKDYRVYALVVPKIQLVIASDTLLTASDKMTDISSKLQARIAEAKTAGKDTTSLDALLLDMQKKVADAKVQGQSIQTKVMPLVPGDDAGNKIALQSAVNMLKTGRQDLEGAKKDGQQILTALKK
jgi:hypothetical protein